MDGSGSGEAGGGYDVEPGDLREAAVRIGSALDSQGDRELSGAMGATQAGHVELAQAWSFLGTAVKEATTDLVAGARAAAGNLRASGHRYDVSDDRAASSFGGGTVGSGPGVPQ